VQTADALHAAGVPATLQTLDGAGHVPWGDYGDQIQQQARAFLYQYLDLEHADR
jgi:pimeloyl-ACP methyl ester carboxylesterase